MKFKSRKKCLSCNTQNLREVINLGNHSFADRFIPINKIYKKDPVYPLKIDLCKKCSFIQSRIITNPKRRYLELDYSYTSSNSDYAKNHWLEFSKYVEKKIKLKKKN